MKGVVDAKHYYNLQYLKFLKTAIILSIKGRKEKGSKKKQGKKSSGSRKHL